MRVITLTEANRNLSATFDRVVDDLDITIITRRGDGQGKRAVVVVSKAVYDNMQRANGADVAAEPGKS
jgi:prevent-host-death family protein